MNEDYKRSSIIKYLIMILAVCAAMMATNGTGFLLVVPFVFSSLFRRKVDQLVFWVLLVCSSPSINSFFMPKNMVHAFSFRVIMLVVGMYGALLFFSRKPQKEITPLFGMLFYLIYMVIPSAQGWAPLISFLKLTLFTGFYLAIIYIATEGASQFVVDTAKFRSVVLAFACFYIFGSIAVYPFPAISIMNAKELLATGTVATSLFKGMTYHSQTLGIVICFWMLFLYVDLIYNVRRPDKLYVVLLLCGLILIYKSSSRTAMGTLIACVIIATWYMMKIRGISVRWRGKVTSVLVSVLAIGFMAVLAVPSVRNGVIKYALKYSRGSEDSLHFDSEYMLKTRQFLVDQQLYNFSKRPAIGWGFQVSEDIAEMMKYSEGIPLTAPVEKGVWVTAILEEGGICGTAIYAFYAVTALFLMISRKAYFAVTMFCALHISNLGEMTMFSMSGPGGMWYMFLGLALIFDVKRNRELERVRVCRH